MELKVEVLFLTIDSCCKCYFLGLFLDPKAWSFFRLCLFAAACVLSAQVPRWKVNGGHLQASPATQRSSGVPLWRRRDPTKHCSPGAGSCHCAATVPTNLGTTNRVALRHHNNNLCTTPLLRVRPNSIRRFEQWTVGSVSQCSHNLTISSYDTNDRGVQANVLRKVL